MLNSKLTFDKTLSLVGDCFKDGYHHGDKSLTGAINKLARNFGCADSLLLGDGFFGSPVNHEAAAPRYTSVKINPDYSKILKESSFLNSRTDEGSWNSLHVNVPIGLSTMSIGIAVGYKSTILPRNIDDVKKYIDGKLKEVKPYFKGFKGKVTRYQNLDKTWLIEGIIEVDDKLQTIHITDLPPMMKYSSFLAKIAKVIEDHDNKSVVTNKSSSNVDFKVKFTGYANEWEHFKTVVIKSTKMLVTETPVFIKDGLVIQYNRIEDYLTDFKYRIAEINLKRAEYFFNETVFDIEFNKGKKLYLEFMLATKRTESEITKFLNKFNKNIASRLDGIMLRHLSDEELKRTADKIIELEKLKIEREAVVKDLSKIFKGMTDVSISRGTKNKGTKDLLEDLDNIDGIDVYKGEDIDIPELQDGNEEDNLIED
jgi:hypothetical protein